MQLATVLPGSRGERPGEAPAQGVASLCLLLLIAADSAFVAVHLVHKHSTLLASDLFSISRDHGYAEIFQYVKIYWIAIMLALLWSRTRERVYGAWMLLFGYLLCDDALQLHERLGGHLAWLLAYRDGLVWAQDQGELTASAAAGLVLFGLIAAAYLRASSEARNVSHDLGLLSGALVFFGVFVDLLHAMVQIPYVKPALGTIEDAGELFVMSAVCGYVLRRLERPAGTAWLWHKVVRKLSAGRLGHA
jgi:hypothetical protein